MTTSPYIIEDNNLSNAWVTAVTRILNSPGKEITPLLIILTGFEETNKIRKAVDMHLEKTGKWSIQTVSETIFPDSLYQLYGKDRFALYEAYLRTLPRIKGVEKSNRGGTYFERMISFDTGTGKKNQLEIIISSLKAKKGERRSKLQASIFDPKTDHTNNPYQRFPCLQHVTFYRSENNGLVLNSFYAIQYLYERGYGNWLGLTNLGKFVSHELGIPFERLNCFVGVELLDIGKLEARELIKGH